MTGNPWTVQLGFRKTRGIRNDESVRFAGFLSNNPSHSSLSPKVLSSMMHTSIAISIIRQGTKNYCCCFKTEHLETRNLSSSTRIDCNLCKVRKFWCNLWTFSSSVLVRGVNWTIKSTPLRALKPNNIPWWVLNVNKQFSHPHLNFNSIEGIIMKFIQTKKAIIKYECR